MNSKNKDIWLELDKILDDQLNLQVELSYDRHHAFILKYGLNFCRKVLDCGTGNGFFVRTLAADHPGISFIGIDKRSHFVDRCNSFPVVNVSTIQLDVQDNGSNFNFSEFDGVLMRFFLLHVSNAKDILRSFKEKLNRGTHIWVIDVDLSDFHCEPKNPSFKLLNNLVSEFCEKNSIDTFAGQKLRPIFDELGFQDVVQISDPFTVDNTPIDEFVKFLTQETSCYSQMVGRSVDDSETAEILQFIKTVVKDKEVKINYGMTLWHALT